MKHHAQAGSISSGTLRTEDRLKTFAAELRMLASRNPEDAQFQAHCRLASEAHYLLGRDWEDEGVREDAGEVLNSLFDALDAYAPEGCRFGAHEGDGADFGYWPVLAFAGWFADGG